MALTDAQWADAVTDIVARMIDGSLTEADAAAEWAAVTGDWTVSASAILELAQRVSRFLAKLNGLIVMDGAPDPGVGELNTWYFDRLSGDFYGPKTAAGWGESAFSLVGPSGASAKQIVINAGLLPANATDAQFATWLADAQIDKVQPLVDAAAASATSAASNAEAAQTAATAAGEARTGAEAAQAAVAGAADATAADRLATGADRTAVAADRTAVEAAASATATHAADAASAAGASVAAKDLAEDAASAAGVSAAATADDALATAADRQAVADDKMAVATDRAAAEAAAGVATTRAGEAAGSAGDADTARVAAQAAQAAAEQARDEAEAIAGGDFVTGPATSTLGRLVAFGGTNGRSIIEGPEIGVGAAGHLLRRSDGDDRYRAAGAVALDDVTGLQTALDDLNTGKQDALGFTPADAADTYTKGAVDGALEAKADLVDGKVPAAQLAAATAAQVRAGKASGVVIEPDEAAGAMAFTALTDAATVAIDLDTGPNFTLTTTAGVGAGRTIGAPSNGNIGQYYTLRITAHAGATVAWNTAFKWPGGTAQAITNTAGAITEVALKMISASRFDVIGFVKDIR